MTKQKDQTQHEDAVKVKKKFKVENFGFLDIEYVGINLLEEEDGWHVAYLFHHECNDDGDTLKAIYHELSMIGDKNDVLQSAVACVAALYGEEKVLDAVMVFNSDGEIIDEFLLSEYAKKLQKKQKQLVKKGN